ncbi:hypothetical protein Flavo103_39770 [Flavobacterium collinsii]|uniref:Uncharacterized protein n=1 Tax=Flavobacterium collinsii TaxID=1114861 RepID=A0A9W4TKL6_9FLAO|nr:hypothetical protein Flavo103_39770 [Flavobacterium collinsii]CAI2768804.1 conserved membrane protein of unknown function [Flavobacterium collinsii]
MNVFFQIGFLIFLIYLAYKSNFLLLFNYIIGFLLILFFTNIYFEGEVRTKSEIIVFLINLLIYSVIFCSSVLIYFDKENKKKNFIIIPVFTYCAWILVEIMIFKFEDSFFCIFLPIALAFFPLYIVKYYRKYIKEE